MSAEGRPELPATVHVEREVDSLCDRFEHAWRSAPEPPTLEDWVPPPGPLRAPGLVELVLLDLEYRARAGQHPSPETYLDRFPELHDDETAVSRIRASAARLLGKSEAAPAQAGQYALLREVGRGGMGVVWRAQDRQFRRDVAVKVLGERHSSNADLARRFVAEARLMARLQHPGIPPVHDVGETPDGRPYFAMKLIEGETLAALLAARSDADADHPRLLAIFEQVCQTMAAAHARGVIHRDLKPANVMVGAYGEVQVMDWGLAKAIGAVEQPATDAAGDEREEPTQQGQAMGTPAFMAPEQARGEVTDLDERCDVFGLGAILCQILTGKAPFSGKDGLEALRLAQEGRTEGALARLRASGADIEVVALAERCLAADREGRPTNAGEVAAAMKAYFAGVQERLRRAEGERLAAEVKAAEERKRRRIAMRLGVVIALLLLSLGAGAWWADRKATETRNQRQREREQGRQGVEGLLTEAGAALAAGKADQAKLHLRAARGRLAEMDEADLAERLEEGERYANVVRELEELFGKHWQVVQHLAIEQLQGGNKGRSLFGKRGSVRYKPGLSDREIAAAYGECFRRRGYDPREGVEAAVARIREAPIRNPLTAAMDQWFLVDPMSVPLLAALNELDAPRSDARRALAARAGSKQPAVKPANEWAKIAWNEANAADTVFLVSELLPRDVSLEVLEDAARRMPEDYRLHTVLAYRCLIGGPARGAEALSHARAASALRPRNAAACLLVAICLQKTDSHDEAVREARHAVSLDPEDTTAQYTLGMNLAMTGRVEEAVAAFEATVRKAPDHHLAHGVVGLLDISQGAHAKGAESLRRAVQLAPTEATYRVGLGLALQALGSDKEAKLHFQAARRIEPDNAAITALLAYQAKDVRGTLASLQTLAKELPSDPHAQAGLGLAYLEVKNYNKAREALKQAEKLAPNNALILYTVGDAYKKMRDYDEAVECLEAAIRIDSKMAKAHIELSLAYSSKGDLDRTIARLRPALKIDPTNSLIYNNLGHAHMRKGEFDVALPLLRKALELHRENSYALNNLLYVLNETGGYAEACKVIEEAMRGPQTKERTALNLESRLGEFKNWIALEAQLIDVLSGKAKPKDYSEGMRFAWICRARGKWPEAHRLIEEALASQPGAADKVTPEYALVYARVAVTGAAKVAEVERPAIRLRALHWLRKHLQVGRDLLKHDHASNRYPVQENVRPLLVHRDLASVRPPELEKLPEDERKQWVAYWRDVRQTLLDAGVPAADLGPGPK